jgi:ABC-type transporter Mla maintaining outer membrane lipid asymmetry permease subunit MlaE
MGGISSVPANLPAIAKNWFVTFFEWFGDLGLFCGRVARATLKAPWELQEFVRQMDAIGSKSFPLVALAGAATGIVLSLQTRESLTRFGRSGTGKSVL